MAVGAKEREAILNAIRVLRKRRVRPSGQKIAWFLRRENLVNEETTIEALDELVRSSDIMRVEYKGAISYRLASSKLKAAKPKLASLDNHTVRRAIFEAISECGPSGGTRHRIAAHLQENGFARIVDRLDVILQREARVGGLAKFSEVVQGKTVHMFATIKQWNLNNEQEKSSSNSDTDCADSGDKGSPAPFQHLQLQLKMLQQKKNGLKVDSPVTTAPKRQHPSPLVKLESEVSSNIDTTEDAAPSSTIEQPRHSKRGRPRKRRASLDQELTTTEVRAPSQRTKRAKKVFDPSTPTELADIKPFAGAVHLDSLICQVCQTEISVDEMLCCKLCSTRVHPSCLGYSEELAKKSRKSPWLCMDCKHCTICDMDHTIATLIFCDQCDRAFHLTCHQPPLQDYPMDSWVCFFCLPSNPKKLL